MEGAARHADGRVLVPEAAGECVHALFVIEHENGRDRHAELVRLARDDFHQGDLAAILGGLKQPAPQMLSDSCATLAQSEGFDRATEPQHTEGEGDGPCKSFGIPERRGRLVARVGVGRDQDRREQHRGVGQGHDRSDDQAVREPDGEGRGGQSSNASWTSCGRVDSSMWARLSNARAIWNAQRSAGRTFASLESL